jgi:hypothetical protein
VIAVAVAVIAAVVFFTGGVVAGSDTPDTLVFFGILVRTTGAQIFLTGAICTWALLAAAWLLTVGVRRSRQRGAQLALLRGRAADRAGAGGAGTDPTGAIGPVGVRELAGLLGFATGPGRVVADRSGLGGGGDTSDAGQHPAEQPPRRQ